MTIWVPSAAMSSISSISAGLSVGTIITRRLDANVTGSSTSPSSKSCCGYFELAAA